MGLYDEIEFECPYCNKISYSQTKLGSCKMEILKKGDIFLFQGEKLNLLMKDGCENCEDKVVVIIENGIITGFDKKENATHKELPFGGLEKIENFKEIIEVSDEEGN